jgi:hypothetical protein
MEVVGRDAHGEPVQGPLFGPSIQERRLVERIWLEQVRKRSNGLREIRKLVVEGPLRFETVQAKRKSGGRLASSATAILPGSSP